MKFLECGKNINGTKSSGCWKAHMSFVNVELYGNVFHRTQVWMLEKGLKDKIRRGNGEINIRHDSYMRNFYKNGPGMF